MIGLRVAGAGPGHADEDGGDHHAGHQRAGGPVNDPGSVALLGLGAALPAHASWSAEVVGARGGRLDLQHAGAGDRARRLLLRARPRPGSILLIARGVSGSTDPGG